MLANQYALELKKSEQNLKNELLSLKYLLGVQEEINIDSADDFVFVLPSNLEDLLKEALDKRTDVLASKSILDVANTNINLQKSLAYPQPEMGLIYNPQNMIP